MYRLSDYMIRLGETNDGKVIEIPDVFIYGLILIFLIIIFTISNAKK